MRRAGLALILAGGLLAAGAGTRDALSAWIDRTDLPSVLAETSVEVLARDGTLLRAFPVEDGRWRLALSLAGTDPAFIDMLIAYEDRRFRSHGGVDALALLRAAGQAAWNGRVVSGGSTLTMQVARLLENGSTGQWPGKMRQMRVALALERRFTKDQILGLYLLHAPYGGNIEGLRAASLAWFGKDPRRLTPAEAALLVALPQSPEARRPDRHAEAARVARDRVLDHSLRAGLIDGAGAEAARIDPMPRRLRPFPALAPHLAERVVAGAPDRRVHRTTIDPRIQRGAAAALAAAMREAPPQVSGAVVVADHRTGEILALVGSPDHTDTARQGFVDMTQGLRSPGSTLKPLVYAMAFDRGLAHPETLIHDGPVSFGRYAPQNFDGVFRGDVRMREALQVSLNIPVIKLTDALGPARVMAALARAGVKAEVPGGRPGLAVALGGLGVSLQDMTQLYAGLARGGDAVRLTHLAEEDSEEGAPIVSPTAAWYVGDILAGLAPPPGAPARAVAYKTGTSYGHRDAWAIGWDGAHVVGVWLGRADGTPVPGAYGAEVAAPVLFDVFARIKPGFAPLAAPPPQALLLGAASLPRPLQRFEDRGTDPAAADRPVLTFPPDGAALAPGPDALTVKLRGGRAPFTLLADGLPVATGQFAREIEVPRPGPGFSALVLVDADGRSDRVTIRLLD